MSKETIFFKKKLPIITGVSLGILAAAFLIGLAFNSFSGNSAIKVVSAQSVYQSAENPQFVFIYKNESNIFNKILTAISNLFSSENKKVIATVKIFDNNDKEIDNLNPQIKEESSGKYSVDLDHSRFQQELRPGKYEIEMEIKDGDKTYIQKQEFRWGVLAINTNKSIYLPGEEAYLQIASLKDDGHTICDANLKLEIITPKDKKIYPEIQKSGKCGPDNVVDVPDYFAHYKVSEPGKYELKLTNLDNGYEITDYFEVRDPSTGSGQVPFDVERTGPTRIWPYAPYMMKIKIKANQDFEGEIKESVPMSFEISGENILREDFHTEYYTKEIFWQINLKAGQVYELKYEFDAPNISPYLYLIGSLKIGNWQEARQWKIASDADLVVSVEHFQISLTDTATSNYGVLSKGQTTANCVPFVTWSMSGTSELMGIYQFAKATIENVSGEDRITVSRYGGLAGSSLVAEVYVVEFNPSAATVSSGSFSMAAATDSTTANPGLTDISNAFLLSYYTHSDNDDEFDNVMMRARITSTTNISFDRYSTSAYGAVDGQWYTVEALNEEFTVQRNTLAMGDNVTTNYQDLSPEVPMNKSFLIFSHDAAESSDDTRDATMRMTLTDTDDDGNAERVVGDAGNGGTPTSPAIKDADWEVVTFASDYSANVQRGVFSFTTGTEASDDTLTTFNADYTIPWGTHQTSQGEGAGTSGAGEIPSNFFRLDLTDTHTIRGTRGGIGGTNDNSDLSWQVIEWMHNNWPDAPDVAETPTFDNMETNDTTPVFGNFSANDYETEDVGFEIQIDDDYEFGSVATTAYSYNYGDGDTGWSAATFLSGASTSYTLEDDDALSNGTTYWWRVRARDPAGSNNWGEYSEPKSITVNTSLTNNQWLQTTDEQFDTGTLNGTATNGSDQVVLGPAITATGGTITESGGYKYHTFTSSGTFEVTAGSGNVEVLVVGGGGGGGTGGTAARGGGGAGGIVYDADYAVVVDSYTVTIGGGGGAGAAGSDSVFDTLTALGGGLGSSTHSTSGGNGGSGGGGSGYLGEAGGTGLQPGSASGGYGNNGGASYNGGAAPGRQGGGGGAGAVGQDGQSGSGGNGGVGLEYSQFSSVGGSPAGWFGGGGGGGAGTDDTAAGSGGQGGGGAGGMGVVGTAGTANTGGGGGGSTSTGGAGGSGIVIVRYSSAGSSGTIESPQIDYSWVDAGDNGWDEVIVGADTTNGSIEIDILDENGDDTGLGCTITGDSCTIDISSLDPDVDETQISILATLTDSSGTPYLEEWTVTWATTGGTPTVSQAYYRWRNDNGSETTATWKEGQGVPTTKPISQNIRLRFSITNTGTGSATGYQFGLQVASKSASTCASVASTSYNPVPLSGSCGTEIACMSDSTYFTQGDAATNQLTATGTFVAGEMVDTASISDAITIAANYFTEVEYNFQFTTSATEGATYCFRLTNNGVLFDAYTKVPEIDARANVNSIFRIKGNTRIKGKTRME